MVPLCVFQLEHGKAVLLDVGEGSSRELVFCGQDLAAHHSTGCSSGHSLASHQNLDGIRKKLT